MKQVIYLDVLLAVDFVIDLCLLTLAGRLAAACGGRYRLAMAAGLAASSALLLLVPAIPGPLALLVRLGMGLLAVRTAFGWHGFQVYWRCMVWYGALNFLLAGAVLFAVQVLKVPGILVYRYQVYFQISPFLLLGCVAAVYLMLEIWSVFFSPPGEDITMDLVLEFEGQGAIHLAALYDTGFALQDVYAGRPVVLVSWRPGLLHLAQQQEQRIADYFEKGTLSPGLQLLPCQTAAGDCVLPAVFCQAVSVCRAGKVTTCRPATVAFVNRPLAQGQYEALIGPQMARQLEENRQKTEGKRVV